MIISEKFYSENKDGALPDLPTGRRRVGRVKWYYSSIGSQNWFVTMCCSEGCETREERWWLNILLRQNKIIWCCDLLDNGEALIYIQ